MSDIEPVPPSEVFDLKFVWNYNKELRMFFRLNDGTKYTDSLKREITEYKIKMLEFKLGYKIQDLEEIISHKQYETQLEKGLMRG